MNILGFSITRRRTKALTSRAPITARGSWWPIVREPFIGGWQSNQDLRLDNVLVYAPVFACVTLIAADIGKLTLRLVYKDQAGVWIEIENPAFSPVLRKPNRYQIITKFIEQWIVSKLIHGNTYVLKERDQRGVVVALYVLDPMRVTPLVATDGSVYYDLQRDDLSDLPTERLAVPAREIIHDTMVALYHPLCGVSPIYACATSALQGLAIQNQSQKFFANGSSPGGVLTAPGAISQDTADRLKAYWDTNYTGDNVGKVAVLGDGLKYETLSVNAVDAELIDQLKMTGETVCTAFHVPPYMVGIGPPPPYANVEPMLQQYYSQCLQSLLNVLERLLDEGLGLSDRINGTLYGTEFDITDLIWMDTATKTSAASASIGAGAMTPNEARKRYFGLPPVSGGATPYMQQQYYSLEALNKRDLQQPPPPTPPPTPTPPTGSTPPTEDDEDENQSTAVTTRALARLIAVKAHQVGLYLKGGAGSGNFGHEGRPGEVGGSAPGTGGGTSVSAPVGPHPTEKLEVEAKKGVAACESLLPKAIDEAEYVGSEVEDPEWDDLSSDAQNETFYKWLEDSSGEDFDVDTSGLDEDFAREMRKDNEEIAEEAAQATIDELRDEWGTPATLPLDPEGGDVILYRRLDPDSITYDEDDGDGAPLVVEELRFRDGSELDDAQKARVSAVWDEKYKAEFDERFDLRYEDDSYQSQESELRDQAQQESWNSMSDEQKFSYAVDYGKADDVTGSSSSVSPGAPDKWVTGVDISEASGEDYDKTRSIARKLAELRTQEIFMERGITGVNADRIAAEVWSEWKGSSTSQVGLAFQLAAAEELDGNHRMTNAELATAAAGAEKVGGMPALKAYVRAQWETTQTIMVKAGQEEADVYRGLMLPSYQIEQTAQASIVVGDRQYVQLPDIQLKRSGAQSTTGTATVANDWGGVGVQVAKPQRVVLRVRAPRTSVISIPVFGQNEQSEHEVVLTGSKDRWQWDAWVGKAPEFTAQPVAKAAKVERKPTKTKPLVIDMQEIDRDQPHWLRDVPSRESVQARELAKKNRKKTFGFKGGAGSGNYGHEGRPGEVGGSAPGGGAAVARHAEPVLAAIRQADGGFTYHPVTGEQPTTGYALSLHKDRERIVPINGVSLVTLAQYAHDNRDLLAKTGNYMGGWHNPNDGKVYLDVSTIVGSAGDAERLGREADQLAYFDLANGKSVEIKKSYGQTKTPSLRHRPDHGDPLARRSHRAPPSLNWARADTSRDRRSPQDLQPLKGGPGSGNFGHEGRPGEVGGSAPSGGGGDSTTNAAAQRGGGWEGSGVTWDQGTDPNTGRPIPIQVNSVEEAIPLVLAGKVVQVGTAQAAYVLIDRLAAMAADATAKGEKAPNYDLCHVTLAGASLFCGSSVRTPEHPQGIGRLYMPQFSGEPVPGSEADKLPRDKFDPSSVDGSKAFVTYLQGLGMTTAHESVPAAGLRASQNQLDGQKVGRMVLATGFDPGKTPVFVSSDDYVVDGHHRWAAVVGRDAADGTLGESRMNIIRINAPITEVLHIGNVWSKRFGIKQKTVPTKTPKKPE